MCEGGTVSDVVNGAEEEFLNYIRSSPGVPTYHCRHWALHLVAPENIQKTLSDIAAWAAEPSTIVDVSISAGPKFLGYDGSFGYLACLCRRDPSEDPSYDQVSNACVNQLRQLNLVLDLSVLSPNHSWPCWAKLIHGRSSIG